MSPIEKFAEENLGIKLLPIQLKMIEAWAENKTINWPKQAGLTTANKVIREYIKASLPERTE